jgi:uncharacterized protein
MFPSSDGLLRQIGAPNSSNAAKLEQVRYRVTNQTSGKLLADQIERADSFTTRFKGLMGVNDLPIGHGLHIVPCNSIHTFFMRLDIDAVFLDKVFSVVEVSHSMAPWRLGKIYFKAHSVLELRSGTAKASGLAVADVLRFEKHTL